MPDGRVPDLEEMPPAIKRHLTNVLARRVVDQEGEDAHGVLMFAYRGTTRPDGSRVPWDVPGWQAWQYLQQDTEAGFLPRVVSRAKAQRPEER